MGYIFLYQLHLSTLVTSDSRPVVSYFWTAGFSLTLQHLWQTCTAWNGDVEIMLCFQTTVGFLLALITDVSPWPHQTLTRSCMSLITGVTHAKDYAVSDHTVNHIISVGMLHHMNIHWTYFLIYYLNIFRGQAQKVEPIVSIGVLFTFFFRSWSHRTAEPYRTVR